MKLLLIAIALLAAGLLLSALIPSPRTGPRAADDVLDAPARRQTESRAPAAGGAGGGPLEKATFAGGCFWCVEEAFDAVKGVVSTTSGYMGGQKKDPTYEEVSAGGTGHAEAVQVAYDPDRVSYGALLRAFWINVDPTTPNRQFCDKGAQYRSVIFYHDATQKRLAEASKRELEESKRFEAPIATEISPASEFYPAEDYHQDYYKKNPLRYKFYKYNCGRARRLEELWGESK